LSVPDIVESGFILGISTLFLIIGVLHHFFNTASGHAFFITAVGHAYSLNTDIREPSSMVNVSFYSTWSLEEVLDTQIMIESILEYTWRKARIITTAISHAYSSHTALQSAGSRSRLEIHVITLE